MKKSKIIIPALAMLVMSTAATVTGTVAWFTMNKTANAEGMVVSAKTSGSLIIKDATGVAAPLPTGDDKATKITFANNPRSFYPSTHNWTNPTTSTATATGLITVSNGDKVNFETGTRMNNTATLTYDSVAQSASSAYYVDYGLFIAGDGIAMPHQDITINFGTAFTALTDINGALSVDFYAAGVSAAGMLTPSSSNYVDTLNLAYRKNGEANAYDEVLFEDVTIPKSGATEGDKAYAITMRVYFDGALIQVEKDNESPLTGKNDFAVYTLAGSDNKSSEDDFLLYSDVNGTSIVPVAVGESMSGKYKVDTTKSTLLFARSIDVADLTQQTIDVHIEANDHPQP